MTRPGVSNLVVAAPELHENFWVEARAIAGELQMSPHQLFSVPHFPKLTGCSPNMIPRLHIFHNPSCILSHTCQPIWRASHLIPSQDGIQIPSIFFSPKCLRKLPEIIRVNARQMLELRLQGVVELEKRYLILDCAYQSAMSKSANSTATYMSIRLLSGRQCVSPDAARSSSRNTQ